MRTGMFFCNPKKLLCSTTNELCNSKKDVHTRKFIKVFGLEKDTEYNVYLLIYMIDLKRL